MPEREHFDYHPMGAAESILDTDRVISKVEPLCWPMTRKSVPSLVGGDVDPRQGRSLDCTDWV